jgi:tellurite resistance protein TehA-like permease
MHIFVISLWIIFIIYLSYVWIKAKKELKIEKNPPRRIELIATLISIPIAILIGTMITKNILFQ